MKSSTLKGKNFNAVEKETKGFTLEAMSYKVRMLT